MKQTSHTRKQAKAIRSYTLLFLLSLWVAPSSWAAPKIASVGSELVREPIAFWEKIRGPIRANHINKFDAELTQTELQEKPGHNFRVRWDAEELAGTPVEIRLVYRQKSNTQPATLKTTLDNPGARNNETLFRVTGERFERFGPVTAWRVELWYRGQRITQKLGPYQNLLVVTEPGADPASAQIP